MPPPDPKALTASTEPHRASVQYPGGLAARYRWVGSGRVAALTALSELGGTLTDHGPLVAAEPDRLCRAELRVEGPLGTWTARFASPVFDDPTGLLWDTPGLIVVKYGFVVYALESRTGVLRWHHVSGSPGVAVLASSRLDHVIAQTEVATLALDATGTVRWRVAHGDVIVAAELVGGRLVLTSWGGAPVALDPVSGTQLGH
jgi:outer membrane protein assembly factor BamB